MATGNARMTNDDDDDDDDGADGGCGGGRDDGNNNDVNCIQTDQTPHGTPDSQSKCPLSFHTCSEHKSPSHCDQLSIHGCCN